MLQGACFGVFLGSMYLCYVDPLVFCGETKICSLKLNETIEERLNITDRILGVLDYKAENESSFSEFSTKLNAYSSAKKDFKILQDVALGMYEPCAASDGLITRGKKISESLSELVQVAEPFFFESKSKSFYPLVVDVIENIHLLSGKTTKTSECLN